MDVSIDATFALFILQGAIRLFCRVDSIQTRLQSNHLYSCVLDIWLMPRFHLVSCYSAVNPIGNTTLRFQQESALASTIIFCNPNVYWKWTLHIATKRVVLNLIMITEETIRIMELMILKLQIRKAVIKKIPSINLYQPKHTLHWNTENTNCSRVLTSPRTYLIYCNARCKYSY